MANSQPSPTQITLIFLVGLMWRGETAEEHLNKLSHQSWRLKPLWNPEAKMNLILNKSVSERVFLSQRWELALQCDVQECSVPWKIKQGSLEILNNSQAFGTGCRLGAECHQCLSGGEIVLRVPHFPQTSWFSLGEGEEGGACFHVSSSGAPASQIILPHKHLHTADDCHVVQ